MADYFVIFGAAVRPDGTPSGTLRRRVEGAFRAGGAARDARYIASGAVGRFGPSEASVMRDLLVELGAPGNSVILEEEGTDTLSSVTRSARILFERGDATTVTVCTSSYHAPRCRMLFRMLGLRTNAAPMPSDRPMLGLGKWLYHLVREAVAIPWDAAILASRRHRYPGGET